MANTSFAKGKDVPISQFPAGMGFGLDTQPPLAGRYNDLFDQQSKNTTIDRVKETIQGMGIDPNSTMGGLFAINLLNKYEAEDMGKLKEQGEYFYDLMQRAADRAQQRGERSTLIAGLVDLPNKMQNAMDRQYTFFPEQIAAVTGSIRRPPFLTPGGSVAQYL
jgi:hypothetical protein